MKKWYASKTIWVNGVAVLTSIVAAKFGYTLSAEVQAGVLAAINVLLRKATKTEIVW